MTGYQENREFRILSAIGIILVTAGHLGFDLFDVGGLFPYYSFHVFIFLFVSGYFYKPECEKRAGRYIMGKCITLLIPYFVWNLLYGIAAFFLHKAGFTIGQDISLYTLFLAPFEGGHQFMYNFPAWFVPVLFLIEVINVCGRKALSFLRLNDEWLIFAGSLLLGIFTVWLAAGGHVWGYYKIPGRILFMLPGYEMGRIYKEKLEKHDRLSNGWYFLIVMGIQLVITFLCGGLAFSAVWVTSFGNGPVVPYLTVITGIAFWLRISRILKEVPAVSQGMVIIGRNTYAVMMHHIMVFFLIKTVFYGIHLLTPFCENFDTVMYFSDINFLYLPKGAETVKWLYLTAGVGIPLLLAGIEKRVRRIIKKI